MSSPDIVCEPCQYRKIRITARIYCNKCQESYCQPCADVHGASKAGRSHLLVDIQSKKKKTTIGNDLEHFQSCKAHSNKSLDFYCSDHSAFLCSMCILTSRKHEKCGHIFEISSAGKALIKTKFTAKLHTDMQGIVNQASSMNETAKKAMMKSKEAFGSFNTQLDNFVEKVDTLVTSLKQQATDIKHEVAAKVDKQQTDFEISEREIGTLVTSIDSCQNVFHTVLKNGSPADVFRCAVSIVGQYNKFKANAKQLNSDVPVVNVVADTDGIIENLKDVVSILKYRIDNVEVDSSGILFRKDLEAEFQRSLNSCLLKNRNTSINIQQFCSEVENVNVNSQGRDTTSENAKQQNAKGSDECDADEKNVTTAAQKVQSTEERRNNSIKYKITMRFDHSFNTKNPNSSFGGIVGLPDGRMVLSDSKHSKLLILDCNDTLLDEIALPHEPGSMTILDDKYLIVCLMKTNLLLVADIGSENTKITSNRFLKTRYHPKCVRAIDTERILVSMKNAQDDWYIHVVSIDGTVTDKIVINCLYFGYKMAIQRFPESYRIILCCEHMNRIRGFESNGKQTFCINSENLSSVVTDTQGCVYVIKITGNIQAYSPDCTSSEVFMTPFHSAKYAAFNADFNKLYITTYKSPTVFVMNVSRTKVINCE